MLLLQRPSTGRCTLVIKVNNATGESLCGLAGSLTARMDTMGVVEGKLRYCNNYAVDPSAANDGSGAEGFNILAALVMGLGASVHHRRRLVQ